MAVTAVPQSQTDRPGTLGMEDAPARLVIVRLPMRAYSRCVENHKLIVCELGLEGICLKENRSISHTAAPPWRARRCSHTSETLKKQVILLLPNTLS